LGGGGELYKKLTEDKEKTKLERQMLRRANDIQIMDSTLKELDIGAQIVPKAKAIKHEIAYSDSQANLQEIQPILKHDEVIAKKRSALFQRLVRYKKIDSFSMKGLDSLHNEIIEETSVEMEQIEETYLGKRIDHRKDRKRL
jgi:hypothetical protein